MKDEQDAESNQSLQAPPLVPLVELDLSHPIEESFTDRKKIEKIREEIRRWTRERAEEVENYLLHFDTFDILSNIMLSQLSIDPETYAETTHEGLSSVVEYACLLMAKHPFNRAQCFVDGQAVEQIIERIRVILHVRILYDATEDLPVEAGQERPAIDFFSFHTKGYESTVRAPGYLHHLRENLSALFDPFSSDLRACLGFDVADVMKIEDAYEEHVRRRTAERRRIANEAKQEFLQGVEKFRNGDIDGIRDEVRRTAAMLSREPDDQVEKKIEMLVGLWMLTFIGGSIYAFTPESLAEISGCPIERVQAVLTFFGLELGSVEGDTSMPSPTHILRSRPFLYQEDEYLYATPNTMMWAARPRIEEAINPNSAVGRASTPEFWQRYEQSRARFLETESIRMLKNTLKPAAAYQNLKYKINPADTIPAELDGLILFDQTLLVVEAKAGSLTATARRGTKQRLENNLKDLFGIPHGQAIRAKQYIEDNPIPEFTDANGETVKINKTTIARVIMVTVTLEALDHYTSHMHEMSRAGIFGEGEMPWAVSLESLRIISEMTEFPSQFLHYLLRRLDVNKLGKFRFFDELDIFGCYLQHGLYLDGDQQVEEADSILFTSFATGFDDYYFYEIGLRETPAHKPIQAMPDLFRKLLLELEGHSDASGFSEVVLQLLNWDGEARNQLASNLERVRVMTLEDGKNHNFTIVSKQAQTGITCVSATEAHQQWGLAELMMLVRRKTTEFRYSQWLGLLTCVGGSSLVHGVFIDHYDESQG